MNVVGNIFPGLSFTPKRVHHFRLPERRFLVKLLNLMLSFEERF
jgi:hypothetical protein